MIHINFENRGKKKNGWLSRTELKTGIYSKPVRNHAQENHWGCSGTASIIELKAVLNISSVLWELDYLELSKSEEGVGYYFYLT